MREHDVVDAARLMAFAPSEVYAGQQSVYAELLHAIEPRTSSGGRSRR